MKKVLYVIAVFLALAVVGVLIVAAFKPDEFRVEREITIEAPAEMVFTQINDFHNWDGWSPWSKLDPDARITHSGASSGHGAKFSWAGNAQMGEGSMTITESIPHSLVRMKLEFLKPFEDTSEAIFTFQPAGQQTKLTWVMAGQNNFISKVFSVFCDMDKMIGGDFEKGLAEIKTISEAQAKKI